MVVGFFVCLLACLFSSPFWKEIMFVALESIWFKLHLWCNLKPQIATRVTNCLAFAPGVNIAS